MKYYIRIQTYMSGGKILDRIQIQLRDRITDHLMTVSVNVLDTSLGRKWLGALNQVLRENLVLEKNYCFFGFANGDRDGTLILDQVNRSIAAINQADLGYQINDHFDMTNCMSDDPDPDLISWTGGRNIIHERFNWLHRYFEDLQGVSGRTSPYYDRADAATRWHIRQLNLLCHEFESWALSYRKQIEAPDWQRPSQLMCWLQAPRFLLEDQDLEFFGIETINRRLGGMYLGVNKAVGKHHWEVFNDEGRDSRVGELVSTTLRSQSEAAADFDIEWAQDPAAYRWQQIKLAEFRSWLIANGFDPEDPSLTIGHPQIGQVDLMGSFGTEDFRAIWARLNTYLDVWSVATSDARAVYDYHWSDADFQQRQITEIERGKHNEMVEKSL